MTYKWHVDIYLRRASPSLAVRGEVMVLKAVWNGRQIQSQMMTLQLYRTPSQGGTFWIRLSGQQARQKERG
jgi:hypothetical protein